jgi:hypothetical protein
LGTRYITKLRKYGFKIIIAHTVTKIAYVDILRHY